MKKSVIDCFDDDDENNDENHNHDHDDDCDDVHRFPECLLGVSVEPG